jgi:hypothetical protein
MISAAERPAGAGSRIVGRGRLLATLRGLIRRVERFANHRAGTAEEQRWAARFADALDGVFTAASAEPGARAGLAAVDRRRRVSRKH